MEETINARGSLVYLFAEQVIKYCDTNIWNSSSEGKVQSLRCKGKRTRFGWGGKVVKHLTLKKGALKTVIIS
jgi:hypothetical protein